MKITHRVAAVATAMTLAAGLSIGLASVAAAGIPEVRAGGPPPTPASGTGARRTQSTEADSTVVSGQVYVRGTRRPVPGVIVQFRNFNGRSVWTHTDDHGRYSIRLPEGVYTAFALIEGEFNIGFDVVGGDNSVSVPPAARVDFEAYQIVPGR